MEAEKKLHLFFLLPVVFHLSTGSLQDSLHCLNDYNNNITCEWNSTSASDQRMVAADTKCNLSVSIIMEDEDEPYSTSCDLRPFDDSKPTMRTCSLVYSFDDVFFCDLTCSINIHCEPLKNSLIGSITYKPADHIKLSPPGRPSINYSTISWKVPGNNLIKDYSFHIQWKQKAQSWKDALEGNRTQCQMELDPDKDLELDETYQVRLRVRVLASESWAKSTWSDWSDTASWRSVVGRIKTTGNRLQDERDGRSVLESWDFMVGVIVGIVVLSLAIILCKTNKNTWVYVVKKFEGPPLPNPAKFFLHDGNLKLWLNPQFNNESIHSCLKKVDISSVEVTSSNPDNIASCGSETALLDRKQRGSFMSSFSNPNYSHLCPPPISSLTEGNLEPCSADSPYGPSGSQNERDEERGKDVFSIGSVMQASSERVENLQPQQRCGLFSTESGICSGEDQFIQDSLNNGDKASIYDGARSKELPGKDRGKEKGKQIHVSNWFTSGKAAFSGRCIEVCSDYERVEKLQDQCCGLQSPDSGICSGGEEQVNPDSLDGGDGITAGHGKELQGTHSDKEKGKRINGSNVVSVGGIVSGGFIQVCSDYERVEKLQGQRCGLLQSPDSGIGSEVEEQVSQETLEGVLVDGLGGSKGIPPPSFVGTFLGLMQEGLSAFPSTRPITSSGDYMPVREIQS